MTINRNLSFVTVLFEGVKAFPNGTELNLLIVLHASHSCLEVIAYHISSDQESRLYIPCKKGLFPDPAKLANSIISRIEILELSETTLTVQISPLQSGDDGNLNFVIDSRPAGLIPLQTCFHFRTHSPRKLIESNEIHERFFQLILLCMKRFFQKVQDKRFREISYFQHGYSESRIRFIEAVRKLILRQSVEKTRHSLLRFTVVSVPESVVKGAWLSQRCAEVFPAYQETRRRQEDHEDSSSVCTDAPADSPSIRLAVKHPASTRSSVSSSALSSVSNSSLSSPTSLYPSP